MAITLRDVYDFGMDQARENFDRKLIGALVTVASEVLAESAATPNHAARVRLAGMVLLIGTQTAVPLQIRWLVALDSTVNGVVAAALTDEALLTAARALWDRAAVAMGGG